jgi:rubrerythrin
MPEGSGAKVRARSGDFVEFGAAGEAAAGEFHCSECGYGVIVQSTLPRCPMCGGTAWEPRGRGVHPRASAQLPQGL